MFAPIAALIFAVGMFSTPEAVESEREWLAQQRAGENEQFVCSESEVTAQKVEEDVVC